MSNSDASTLHRLATLMDEDDARTNKVGIPVSYGHHLIWLAVIGTYEAWEAEWVRLAKTKSVQAANDWSAGIEAEVQRLIELVYPGGITARPQSAQGIRVLAAQIQTAA
jgi:hypothetical protein